MAKRIADKELTDRNWDQEDEGEEAGTFSIASDDVLKNRPIKKAKRRNVGESENAGAFKGFKGFSLMSSGSAAPATGFSGFGNGGGFKGLAGLTNGSAASPFAGFSSPTAPGLTFNGPSSSSSSSTTTADITTNGSAPSSTQSPGALGSSISAVGNNKEYSRQLTALNCSVRDWIVKHVNGNPLCDLNPIFRDYERHLASIERKYGATAAATTTASTTASTGGDGGSHGNVPGEKPAAGTLPASASPSASSSSFSSSAAPSSPAAPPPSFSSPVAGAPVKTPAALFSFGREADAGPTAPVPAGVTFNFGQKPDAAALGSLVAPSFSFSAGSSSSSSSSSAAPGQGALFGSAGATPPAAPFSRGGTPADAARPSAEENGEEESEEPPKPEVREIKEKDAFYSQRCKLFYKKDSEFKEKGVGTLHLKPTGEGRTQLVIRADTNLGNILLNIVLQASMPSSRMGKNNVMLACVPNPPVDPKNAAAPVPMLIRVKTSEDADALHKILEEKKT